VREVLDNERPAAVMHVADYINVGESVQKPVL
jgi:UDP-glucose 4-epimerase